MPRLSAEAVLAIWEQAPIDDAVRGPLTVLAHAYPELSEDNLLDLSIGERDSLLLQLRHQLFGENLDGFAHCPSCDERLEFSITVGEIRRTGYPGVLDRVLDVKTSDVQARMRLPNSHDLVQIQRCQNPERAAHLLFERCIERIECQGRRLTPGELPEDLLAMLDERLSQQQGLADLELEIQCDACGHSWKAQLDIASFFIRELGRYAGQLLDQVHMLATAYGWTEQAILGMHPHRRSAYLERLLT
jgi:hypothetical protein